MAVNLRSALHVLPLAYAAWASADARECGIALGPDVQDDEFSLLHTHAHKAVRGWGRSQSRDSDGFQQVHSVEEHQLPTPGWVEQVLALFPPDSLNDRARAAIREQNLIPQLEQFMRNWSAWDGYNETDHLIFWRAQQPMRLVYRGQHPQYVGQPSRFDGSRLEMNWERDGWSQVIRRDLFFDDGVPGLPPPVILMDRGQYYNNNQRLEAFGTDWVPISWGYAAPLESGKVQVLESLPAEPFKPYDADKDPEQNMQSYFVTNATAPPQKREFSPHRSFTLLEGPGYQIKFMNVWNFDEAGRVVIQRSDTSCEVMLSEAQSREIDRKIGEATCAMLLRQNVTMSIMSIDPYGKDSVDADQLHGIFYGIRQASNMTIEAIQSAFASFGYWGPSGLQYTDLSGLMLKARDLCM